MALKYIYEDGTEIQEYDITLKTEVTLELIAGTKAKLWRYLEKNMIDKEKEPQNPLSVISWDLEKMRRLLYGVPPTFPTKPTLRHKMEKYLIIHSL